MTPGMLIFTSAPTIYILAVVKYIRPETIGLIPDGFAIASTFKEFRTIGITLVRFFLYKVINYKGEI